MEIVKGSAPGPETSYITSRLTAMNNLLPMQVLLKQTSISFRAKENDNAKSGSVSYNDSSNELIKDETCFILW